MQCPVDGAVLVMSERSGIEIDYCPTCRGVWLDRGELDKILERAAREQGAQAPQQSAPQQPQYQQPQYQQPAQQGSQNPMDLLRQMTGQGQGYEQRGYDDRRGYDQGYPRKKKKESWLSELFD
ncbi:zf-TFIIB domain-containing protein [Agromyces soli]|uniref:Zf-TFIIB domain-containing protein n=1 Tax=Agromyces soli TaxID=659012 RepID=A0ABY4AX49_9MICO|nr:zf-TFIIB domain-containing protein [Agromyces soli]UOE27767.1 zf-TFIIB domain-containing protein [Agromyces soli]